MEKLKKIMADIFRIPEAEVTEDITMEDVEAWDSLKHMDMIVSIEETFDVKLTVDEITAMVSVNEIKRILKSKRVEI